MNRVEIGIVALALSLHAGGLAFARSIPKVHVLQKSFRGSPMLMVDTSEMELPTVRRPQEPKEERPTQEEPREHEEQASATTPNERVATHDRRRVRISNGGSEAPGPGEPSGPGVMTTEDGGDSTWGVPESDGPIDPGGIGPNISGVTARVALSDENKAKAAPTDAPKAKKVDRDAANVVIKDEMRKRDKGLGLDLPAAGTVASIIKSAVQGSEAPANVNAQFAVALGPGGKVVSVKFISASAGDSGMWNGIAKMVLGALKSQKLTLTEDYAKGANITVNVASALKMPSGAEPGAGPKLSLTQNFDVADIGAKPQRVIKVSHSVTPVK